MINLFQTFKDPAGLKLDDRYLFQLHFPIRARYVRVTPLSSRESRCMRLEIHGEKASACPPRYALYGQRCYRMAEPEMTYEGAQQSCSRDVWMRPGNLAEPNNAEINGFLAIIGKRFDILPTAVHMHCKYMYHTYFHHYSIS